MGIAAAQGRGTDTDDIARRTFQHCCRHAERDHLDIVARERVTPTREQIDVGRAVQYRTDEPVEGGNVEKERIIRQPGEE